MMLNTIIVGVGGQGTVLMSRLIGMAAIAAGNKVRGTETIGMAQRGGSVVSHVRMGDTIHSPLIPPKQADLIIAFEPGEAVRALPFLKEGGSMIVYDAAIKPVTSSLSTQAYEAETMIAYLRETVKNLTVINGERIVAKTGNAKVINVALLGVAVGKGYLPFGIEEMEKIIKIRIPQKFIDMNMQAFHIGIAFAGKEN